MSENNLSSIISSLAANKDFADMVEKFKESGDFSSVLSEVSSLLGGMGEDKGGAESDSGTSNILVSDRLASLSTDEDITEEKATHESDQKTLTHDSSAENEAKQTGLFGKQKEMQESDFSSLFGGLLPLFSKSISENSALLLALKPYLSKRRCDLIDNIIKISKLASIVSL